MRFLVLTDDDSALPVIEAIITAGHVVAGWWAKSNATRERLHQLSPTAECQQPGELLLQASTQDRTAVLVAGTEPATFAVARQLGTSGLPLLVVTTNAGPVSSLFELMPVWEERRAWIVPVFTSELEGQEHLLQKQWKTVGISEPVRIEFQREVIHSAGLVPLAEVYRLLFQDLGWLTRLSADDENSTWDQVGTLWLGQHQADVAQATVKFSGVNSVETTWSVKSSTRNTWTLSVSEHDQQCLAHSGEDWPPLADQIQKTLSSFAELSQQPCVLPLVRTWKDVLHCGQLLAAVQQSALRQRQVAIRYEEISGRSQFKSQMSAFGCGALLWAMFAGMGWLLVAATLDPRDREQKAAEASGFVFDLSDFEPDHGPLTAEGWAQVDHVARNWTASTAPVILNVSEQTQDFDHERFQLSAALQERLGAAPSAERIQLRRLPGGWFRWAVLLGWGVVFAPLAIVLLAQGLIVATPGTPNRG